jgi:hypothetical protein
MLVEISTGELIDKITILQIKAFNISDPVKNANINYELGILKGSARSEIKIDYDDDYKKLYNINWCIWQVEDKIRKKEKEECFDEEFIELARAVYIYNDERAKVKKEINLKTESKIVEEKSY